MVPPPLRVARFSRHCGHRAVLDRATCDSLTARPRAEQRFARPASVGPQAAPLYSPESSLVLYQPEGEAKRKAVNNWIRNGDFDAVIDFDAAVRDPDHPTRIRADYDVGDHLHPNDAGYRAMGEAVDLKLFD